MFCVDLSFTEISQIAYDLECIKGNTERHCDLQSLCAHAKAIGDYLPGRDVFEQLCAIFKEAEK